VVLLVLIVVGLYVMVLIAYATGGDGSGPDDRGRR